MKANVVIACVISCVMSGCQDSTCSLMWSSMLVKTFPFDGTYFAKTDVSPEARDESRDPFSLPSFVGTQPSLLSDHECVDRIADGSLLHRVRLKGIIRRGSQLSAVIETPDGEVKKVLNGQRLAQGSIVVEQITAYSAVVREVVLSGGQCANQAELKLILKRYSQRGMQ